MSKYGVISGPYFPAFGLNTVRYFVSLRIQSECGKYGTEINPYLDTFHAVTSTIKWVKNYLATHGLNYLSNWRFKLKLKIEIVTNNTNDLLNSTNYK